GLLAVVLAAALATVLDCVAVPASLVTVCCEGRRSGRHAVTLTLLKVNSSYRHVNSCKLTASETASGAVVI
ncbi:hypothetical protein, partial [Mycobacterium sp. E1747]|uniref:hypothetical protein n=1 Tax=Mycobacterium sp. E1747 TaxID=1834128 RepID=UPI000A8A4D8E